MKNAVIQEALNIVTGQVPMGVSEEQVILASKPQTMEYLTAAESNGNQHASQELQCIRHHRNWSATIGILHLFRRIGSILQNGLEKEWDGKERIIDRKLRKKIAEKKALHGLHQA